MRPSLEHPFTPIVAEGQKGDKIDFMTFLRILYVKVLILFTTPTSVLYIFNRNRRQQYENEKLDEAVALVFRAPHSYTGENVVELSCHGGIYITRQVLRAVLEAGAKRWNIKLFAPLRCVVYEIDNGGFNA